MNRIVKGLQMAGLGAAGIATFYLAATWSRAEGDAGPTVEAVEPAAGRVAVATAAVPAVERDASLRPPERLRGVPDAGTKADPFGARSWLPPPPPPKPVAVVVPPPPAPPTAPPLPYVFVGMLEGGTAQPQAFLAKGETLLVVSAGDVLDSNSYRVESLGPQQIVLTYLPLNTRQTLNVSGAAQ